MFSTRSDPVLAGDRSVQPVLAICPSRGDIPGSCEGEGNAIEDSLHPRTNRLGTTGLRTTCLFVARVRPCDDQYELAPVEPGEPVGRQGEGDLCDSGILRARVAVQDFLDGQDAGGIGGGRRMRAQAHTRARGGPERHAQGAGGAQGANRLKSEACRLG